MMQGLRNAGKSWLGKIVITIMFGFLILSFAIWGIEDVFRGGLQRNNVISVGSTQVSADTIRNAYQTELQQTIQRLRRAISPEQARALGLDAQVLSRLVTEASLDEYAKRNGLAVSDQTVIDSVVNDPSFRGADGRFNRDNFLTLIRQNGFTEAGFLTAQKSGLSRLHIAEAVAGAVAPPTMMLEALVRYGSERRSASYLTLPASAVGAVTDPDDATLRAYFEARRSAYRAPEYRRANVLVLSAESASRATTVSDADVAAAYERDKATRFTTPERRAIQIVVFQNAEEAANADQRLKAGETLEAVAGERGVTDLGTVAKSDIFDTAVADAAFALAPGTISAPIAGRFGTTVARVTAVEPAGTRPLAEVQGDIRQQLATARASETLSRIHDEIEDKRLSAQPLPDIARAANLPLTTIEGIDAQGRTKDGGALADIPEAASVVQAIFNSDVGIDNEAVRLRDGGYVWFEVLGSEPARDRAFEEVRADVLAQWRGDEVARRLGERARELVAAIAGGKSIETLASEQGLTVETATDLARNSGGELGAGAIAQIFSTTVGRAGSAARGEDRIVFVVTGATVPPLTRTTQAVTQLETSLRTALSDDLLAEFVLKLQADYGANVNQQTFRNATTGSGS